MRKTITGTGGMLLIQTLKDAGEALEATRAHLPAR